jgi:hypothetical protein
MVCKSCGSADQQQFQTEMAIHARDLNKPLVFVFPKILICMNCGRMELAEEPVVPEVELQSFKS